LFKKGLRSAQQALVDEGQANLRRVGIDPIYGKENLVWAPWRVSKQHGIDSLRKVVNELRALERAGGDYDDFVDLLKSLARLQPKGVEYVRHRHPNPQINPHCD
jgi:hypothetical protein